MEETIRTEVCMFGWQYLKHIAVGIFVIIVGIAFLTELAFPDMAERFPGKGQTTEAGQGDVVGDKIKVGIPSGKTKFPKEVEEIVLKKWLLENAAASDMLLTEKDTADKTLMLPDVSDGDLWEAIRPDVPDGNVVKELPDDSAIYDSVISDIVRPEAGIYDRHESDAGIADQIVQEDGFGNIEEIEYAVTEKMSGEISAVDPVVPEKPAVSENPAEAGTEDLIVPGDPSGSSAAVDSAELENPSAREVEVDTTVPDMPSGGGVAVEPTVPENSSGGGMLVEPTVSENSSGGGMAVEPTVSENSSGGGMAVEPTVSENSSGDDAEGDSIIPENPSGSEIGAEPENPSVGDIIEEPIVPDAGEGENCSEPESVSCFLLDEMGMLYGFLPEYAEIPDGCLTLPAECTGIRQGAFSGCGAGILELYIPAGAIMIEAGALSDLVSLEWIDVEVGNCAYVSDNGVLFDSTMSVLMAFPAGWLDIYMVPSYVTRIADRAFDGTSIYKLDLRRCAILAFGENVFGSSGGSGIQVAVRESEIEMYAGMLAGYAVTLTK